VSAAMVLGCSASPVRTSAMVSLCRTRGHILGPLNTIDGMDEQTITKPTRSPGRTRPARRRRHGPREPHVPRHTADDASAQTLGPAFEQAGARIEGGGGSSGRGPVDDDGGGRRPDRDGDDSRLLLIALGIIALGASVISARRFAKAGRLPQIS
jgi:hypothetical protein